MMPAPDPLRDAVRSTPTEEAKQAPQLPAVIGGRYRPIRLIAKGGMGAVYEVVHAQHRRAPGAQADAGALAADAASSSSVSAARPRVHSSVKSENVVRVVDADVAPELDGVAVPGDGAARRARTSSASASSAAARPRRSSTGCASSPARSTRRTRRRDRPPRSQAREPLPRPARRTAAHREDPRLRRRQDGVREPTATRRRPAQILGTPRYMAPEQATDAKQISAAADRFALGLIAFRLLCGRHYFAGDNLVVLLQERRTRPAREAERDRQRAGPGIRRLVRASVRAGTARTLRDLRRAGRCARAGDRDRAGAGAGGDARAPGWRRSARAGWRWRRGRRCTGRRRARRRAGRLFQAIAPPTAAPPATTTAAPAATATRLTEPGRGCRCRDGAHTDRGGGAFHRLAAAPGRDAFVEAQGAVFERRQGEKPGVRDRFGARAGSDLGRTVIATRADQGPVSITMFLTQ